MSQPTETPATTHLAAAPRQGCGRRLLGFIGWLLTLALSAALGLAALAGIAYFVFGFDLTTPERIRQSSADVVALQGQAGALTTEVAQLRTAEVEHIRQLATANERVDALEAQVTDFTQQAASLAAQGATASALARELNQNIALAATIQAEGRQGQIFVSVVATTQADTTTRVGELQRRTERITRFVQRLGDLAGEVGADSAALPTGTPAAAPATPTATAAGLTPTVTP